MNRLKEVISVNPVGESQSRHGEKDGGEFLPRITRMFTDVHGWWGKNKTKDK